MRPLNIVHLRGSHAQMGAQYGRMVADSGPHDEAVWTLSTLANRMLSDANHHTLEGRLVGLGLKGLNRLANSRLQKHRPPEQLERDRAFLEACGMGPNLMAPRVVMDLFQNSVSLAGRHRIGPFALQPRKVHPACSSLAVWGSASSDGQLRHARNLDLPCIGTWEDLPTVTFCTPDDGLRYGSLGAFGVDTPGVTGFNEAGLTIAPHTRFHRDTRYDGAGIVDLSHRIIQYAETLDDAVRIARERPVASTWGMCITSARDGTGIIIETTGQATEVLEPGEGRDYVTCTNLHRHPNLVDGQVAPFPAWYEHADGREQRLIQRAEEGALSMSDLARILGDFHDVHAQGAPRIAGGILAQSMSVNSIVLEPANQNMWVSVGDTPTGCGPWVEVPWSWDAPVGHTTVEPEPVLARLEPHADEATSRAYDLWRAACRADVERHDTAEVLSLVEQAMDLVPDSPSFRFVVGVLRLRMGEAGQALEHFEAGRQVRQSAFREGQFWLWGARALDQLGRTEQARTWRTALLDLQGPHVDRLKAYALAEQERPLPAR
ncbi:MAG: C45 family autoproteolytic acyltransferase/hydrolase, partial [Myxococcota bacterium]|nr:C45 family autoproteolytic acyltransferase/hydrolase [Myxococcota bacterium]